MSALGVAPDGVADELGAPPGLPERLPSGERILWQGAPDWRVLAVRVFHVRKLAVYFAIIVCVMAIANVRAGLPAVDTALSLLFAVGVACVPLALICVYAWIVARMTVYTLTNRRVAMRVGIALPVTIYLPFARIEGASLTRRADGTGSIALALMGTDRLGYAIIWPHARPWRFARAEPTLRGLRDAQPVAQMLARALAASADMAAPVLDRTVAGQTELPHAAAAA